MVSRLLCLQTRAVRVHVPNLQPEQQFRALGHAAAALNRSLAPDSPHLKLSVPTHVMAAGDEHLEGPVRCPFAFETHDFGFTGPLSALHTFEQCTTMKLSILIGGCQGRNANSAAVGAERRGAGSSHVYSTHRHRRRLGKRLRMVQMCEEQFNRTSVARQATLHAYETASAAPNS